MPAILALTLEGRAPPNPFRHADGLRALVLASVARADRALATAIHDANQPKPYAMGPLEAAPGPPGRLRCEIGCAADWAAEAIMAGLPPKGARIDLGRDEFRFEGAQAVRRASYAEMLDAGPEGHTIHLRLTTPTAHHASGPTRRTIVVPDPTLYAGSWLRRWNLFAGTPFSAALLEAVAERVVVGAFSGGTHAVALDRRRVFLGFVGHAHLVILPTGNDGPDPLPSALWALARLAEYCGTGVDTMRGMGRTRILRPAGEGGVPAKQA
ncbi:MAG TPA: CRISPR system precrRNA processing endoribonuclease RAMP protein Cas6 [Chthonomonadales bacterium]|nr:CRISPR system precrRNA processing endoribonuclease RAMP protein Cas6 [Chthonomonadales bacterium]